MEYPEIISDTLKGYEGITDLNGNNIATVLDFWRWAHSDLVANAERGIFAEFIVSRALGIQSSHRVEWDSYDLQTSDGIKIEVKSSGYIQTWNQKRLSSLQFGIQPTKKWNRQKNIYEKEKIRQSDIYVFCVHKHKEQETVNPLDLSQWDFYVLPTYILNEKVNKQKTITISSLLKLGAQKCRYEQLKSVVNNLSKKINARKEQIL